MRTTAPENKYLVIICVHDFKNKLFLCIFLYSITLNNSSEMGFFWKQFFFLAKISEINIYLGKDAHLDDSHKNYQILILFRVRLTNYEEMLKILIVVEMFFYCELFMCLYISTAFNLNLKSQFLMLSFPFKLLKEYNVKNETVPTMFRSNQTGHSKNWNSDSKL